MDRAGIGRVAAVLLACLLLLVLYYPILRWLVNSWLNSPQYSHGFFVPLISVFIAWTRRRDLRGGARFPGGIWLLASGLALHVVGFLYVLEFASAISLLLVIAGLILYVLGLRALRPLAFPLGFLVFGIPLPFLDTLGLWLQLLSARSSASIISLLGIPITRIGAELHLEEVSFVVGLACSGMNSLLSLLALSAVFGYVVAAPFYKKAILFALAFPVAVLANILRLVSLLLIGNQWGSEAAMGFLHGFFSPLYFGVSMGCLLILARPLGCSLPRINRRVQRIL